MKASLKKRLLKLEQVLAKRKHLGLLEIFFIPDGCKNITSFQDQCLAAIRKDRIPLFIEFIGPAGGPELGTGRLRSEEVADHFGGSQHDEAV